MQLTRVLVLVVLVCGCAPSVVSTPQAAFSAVCQAQADGDWSTYWKLHTREAQSLALVHLAYFTHYTHQAYSEFSERDPKWAEAAKKAGTYETQITREADWAALLKKNNLTVVQLQELVPAIGGPRGGNQLRDLVADEQLLFIELASALALGPYPLLPGPNLPSAPEAKLNDVKVTGDFAVGSFGMGVKIMGETQQRIWFHKTEHGWKVCSRSEFEAANADSVTN